MTDEPYEIVVTRPAANTISEELPEAVAAAVIVVDHRGAA